MEFQRIRYFLKAAKTQNFSQAAKEMYISPQALTKQITLLEQELGVKLFERSTRHVKLTETGLFAEGRFSQVEHMLNEAVEQVKEFGLNYSGKFRVGFFASLPRSELVTPVLNLILANLPNSHIELRMLDLTEIRSEFMDGKLDLAFTNVHSEEDWGNSRKLVFCNVPAQVAVSLYHPWAMKSELTKEDMEQETFLKLGCHNPYRKEIGPAGFYDHIPCKDTALFPDFNTMLTMLTQGKGFALFPRAFHADKDEKLKYFSVPGCSIWFQTAVFYHSEESETKILQMIQLLKEEFSLTEEGFPAPF